MNTNNKLVSLEVGRGIAALLVCLFHYAGLNEHYFGSASYGSWFIGGDAGVEYFFVLSGFIIYWVHRLEIGDPDKVGPFFTKRFIRLYPIYWVIVIPVATAMLLLPALGQEKNLSLGKAILDVLLIPREGNLVISPAWTLHRELVFYILFGFALWKPRTGFTLLLTWQCACLMNAVLAFTPSNHTLRINVLFGRENLGFGLGLVSAWLCARYPISELGSKFVSLAGIVIFVGLIASQGYMESATAGGWSSVDDRRIWEYGLLISPFFIVLGLVNVEQHVQLKVPAWLVSMGAASYVLYIIHLPAGSLIFKLLKQPQAYAWLNPMLTYTLATLLVVIASIYIHKIVEKPIISWCRGKLLAK